jgi:hypothetical protein
VTKEEPSISSQHKQKPKFLTFAITLLGLYLLTAWAGFALLQPQPVPFFTSAGLVGFGGYSYVTEWWQYILFALYNLGIWVGAYVVAARVVPKFFS